MAGLYLLVILAQELLFSTSHLAGRFPVKSALSVSHIFGPRWGCSGNSLLTFKCSTEGFIHLVENMSHFNIGYYSVYFKLKPFHCEYIHTYIDIVGTVYHLVIYMKSNKIHKVF